MQEQAAKKVNGIKIWVDDRGGRAPRLSTALFRAGIDEGHKLGLPVTAHVYYHVDAVDLVDAGINSIAHLVRDKEMDDALVAAIVKRNVYVMPNLGGAERAQYTSPPAWIDEPGLVALLDETVAPDVIARMKTAFATRDPAAAARARAQFTPTCSAAWRNSMPPERASYSAATPASKIISSATPSSGSSSRWRPPA